jgi:alkanesulfonate monooxygenase SsuD/methylene tetrahydromethanopterin reductase-like flavin-dependent oxidoreductase (luciferase family)
MAAVNVVAADSDTQARHLFTSHQQRVTDMLRNSRATLAPPIDDIDQYWTPAERAHAERMLECSIVGGPEAVARGLQRFIDRTGADEVMVNGMIYDHAARVRSFELLAQAAGSVVGPDPVREESRSRVAA